jgi:phosphoglycolate phosphatase
MARNFDLIVFDWDGTLMDSAGVIVDSIRRAARDLGLPPPPEEDCRHIIGLGLSEALARLFPGLAHEAHPRLVERYRYHYLGRDAAIPLFPGAGALVRTLAKRDYLLAVATGKSRTGLDRVLRHTGLATCFHATRCADECFSKPHPQMLEELMDELGVRRERTLMVGDTSHDMQMAANAGVPALAVSYGAHAREDLLALNPLACVDSVEELKTWLETCA